MEAFSVVLQVRRTRHEPRDGDPRRRDHVHGHGLHHLPEPASSRKPRRRCDPARGRPRPPRSIAGIMTIAMGVVANYPFALAAGLGINGIVAFSLADAARASTLAGRDGRHRPRRRRRHDPRRHRPPRGDHERRAALAQARDRRRHRPVHPVHRLRRRRAHPRAPRRAGSRPVELRLPDDARPVPHHRSASFITVVLFVLQGPRRADHQHPDHDRLALVVGVAKRPARRRLDVHFDTVGQFDLGAGRSPSSAPCVAVLTIFSIMLTDFFDTMGTVTGIAERGRPRRRQDGRSRASAGSCSSTRSRRSSAGSAGISLEHDATSRARPGVAEGGRTGFASVVTGVLFLLAIFLSPAAPARARPRRPAPVLDPRRLPDVHPRQGHRRPRRRGRASRPSSTIILMPLTYDITVGIGAGFIAWIVHQARQGQGRRDPPA